MRELLGHGARHDLFDGVPQPVAQLGGQALSFKVTSYTTRQTIVSTNVAPANWCLGLTYQARVNFS